MRKFYDQGLQFSCAQCAHCCKDEPGFVFLSDEEIEHISSFLDIPNETFLKTYCRLVPMGNFSMISIIEKPNNDCIFLNESGCSIYEVRPLQCRSYPFWESILDSKEAWDREAEVCPGMNRGKLHSKEEIEDWIIQKRRNHSKIVYNKK